MIETDILGEFLVSQEHDTEPRLARALRSATCYTTMLNAFELLRAARSEEEHEAIHAVLTLVRVLGYNARTAIPIASLTREIEQRLFSQDKNAQNAHAQLSSRDALILGMAAQSKLTILTEKKYDLYTRAAVVPVIQDTLAVATNITRENGENGSQNIFDKMGIAHAKRGVAHSYHNDL